MQVKDRRWANTNEHINKWNNNNRCGAGYGRSVGWNTMCGNKATGRQWQNERWMDEYLLANETRLSPLPLILGLLISWSWLGVVRRRRATDPGWFVQRWEQLPLRSYWPVPTGSERHEQCCPHNGGQERQLWIAPPLVNPWAICCSSSRAHPLHLRSINHGARVSPSSAWM